MSIYVPSSGPDAWKQFLAEPELHWATGYSARTLASCWEAASGLPPEIAALIEPLIGPSELLLAFPEHKVPLPGGCRDSQSDVFALVRGREQVVACAIEGKVDEPFGPTVSEWLVNASAGKRQRLNFITDILGLSADVPGDVRYQLLHRTASAVVETERFMTGAAAMLVHSFSPTAQWFGDFRRFLELFGLQAEVGEAVVATLPTGKPLYLGWAAGEERFRTF